MSTIICAVDASPASATALDVAVELANQFDARLVVAYVEADVAGVGRDELFDRATDTVADIVRDHGLQERAVRFGLVGRPVMQLVSLAADEDAAMIVLGGQHKGRARAMFRSRLAQQLARSTSVPVVLAPFVPEPPAQAPVLSTESTRAPEPVRASGARESRKWSRSRPRLRPRPQQR